MKPNLIRNIFLISVFLLNAYTTANALEVLIPRSNSAPTHAEVIDIKNGIVRVYWEENHKQYSKSVPIQTIQNLNKNIKIKLDLPTLPWLKRGVAIVIPRTEKPEPSIALVRSIQGALARVEWVENGKIYEKNIHLNRIAKLNPKGPLPELDTAIQLNSNLTDLLNLPFTSTYCSLQLSDEDTLSDSAELVTEEGDSFSQIVEKQNQIDMSIDEQKSISRYPTMTEIQENLYLEVIALLKAKEADRSFLKSLEYLGISYDASFDYILGSIKNNLTKFHTMTSEEMIAILLFTSHTTLKQGVRFYSIINNYLNRVIPKPNDPQVPKKILKPLIKYLNSGLNKLPDFKGKVIRRAELPENILNQLVVGSEINFPAFTSASNGSEKTRGHRIIIHSKHGKAIDKYSFMSNEKEVLFKSNSRFRVLGRQPQSGGTFEIELEEIE